MPVIARRVRKNLQNNMGVPPRPERKKEHPIYLFIMEACVNLPHLCLTSGLYHVHPKATGY